MNRNPALFISTILFVVLFYHQTPGLNLGIFSVLVWVMLLLIPGVTKSRSFWWLSAATLLSAVSFAWYGDFLSFASLLISLLLTGYKALYPSLRLITFPFAAFYNYVTFIIRAPQVNTWIPGTGSNAGSVFKKLLTYFIIPVGVFLIFALVYAQGSSKFAALFHLNWQVDLGQIIVLLLVGFFLMFSFFHFSVPEMLVRYNGELLDDFGEHMGQRESPITSFFDLNMQRRSGEVTLVLLNALLIFFNVVYVLEQFGQPVIGDGGGSLSSGVHERVYALIFSIVMAVLVIMIYFRKELNFEKDSRLLKILSMVWIGLNAVLVVIVMAKNIEYVQAFGLTFRRIGVFIFLLLALTGLALTRHKLASRKTNWFLITRMTSVCLGTLVISAAINWSWLVTKYNLRYQEKPDMGYLFSLHYNRGLLDQALGDNHSQPYTREKNRSYVEGQKESKLLSRRLYYFSVRFE